MFAKDRFIEIAFVVSISSVSMRLATAWDCCNWIDRNNLWQEGMARMGQLVKWKIVKLRKSGGLVAIAECRDLLHVTSCSSYGDMVISGHPHLSFTSHHHLQHQPLQTRQR